MLRIAICDDNQVELQYTARMTADYFGTHPAHSAIIETFHSGKDLLSQAEARKGFDLYILDIIMPGLNGIQTAALKSAAVCGLWEPEAKLSISPAPTILPPTAMKFGLFSTC